MKKLFLFLFCLISSLGAVEYYDDKRIARIDIVVDTPTGETSIDPKPILSRMKTRVGTDFSQLTFDADLKTLSEQYDRIYPKLEVRDGGLYITLHLTLRPVIHAIEWSGNERVSLMDLQSELDIRPNTVYNRQEFNKAFNKVKELYFKKGFFESQLSYSIRYLPDESQVDILIEINEGKPGYIKQINLHGFSREEEKDLREQMYLKKYNFLLSWITGNGIYREEALEQDRMTILNYLHNKGYADARIDISFTEDPVTGKLILDITAEKGENYHIGAIRYEGNTFLPTSDLEKHALLKQGDLFSPDKVRDAAQVIKDLYGQKAYIEASVQYETRLAENEALFDIEFFIDEGRAYKIGLIHIFGNSATQNHVILRESLLVPGEPFDLRKLKATQQRLEAVGYFKSVNVYAVRTSEDNALGENYRDVYIEVEETSTGSVSLFAGFSSLDDVVGGLDLSERNFNIKGLGRIFKGDVSTLRGNGEYFHIRGAAGSKQNSILISWLDPYFRDSLWRLGVELSRTQSHLQNNMQVITWGGSVWTNYPLNNYWTVGMRQRDRYSNDSLDLNPYDDSKLAKSYLRQLKHVIDQKGTVSAFSANLVYDSINDPYRPRRGWRSYFEVEIAGLGGHYNFGKISYTNRIYFPLWSKGTIKLRGDFQFILPFGKTKPDTVPYSERLFLGGENTVRGYKNFLVGPVLKLVDWVGNFHYTKTPQGGISSALLSIEYNQEIIRVLDAFVYCDVASVQPTQLSISHVRPAMGGGIRLDIGNRIPIMVGFGVPLISKDRHNSANNVNRWQKFFFTMSGQF